MWIRQTSQQSAIACVLQAAGMKNVALAVLPDSSTLYQTESTELGDLLRWFATAGKTIVALSNSSMKYTISETCFGNHRVTFSHNSLMPILIFRRDRDNSLSVKYESSTLKIDEKNCPDPYKAAEKAITDLVRMAKNDGLILCDPHLANGNWFQRIRSSFHALNPWR